MKVSPAERRLAYEQSTDVAGPERRGVAAAQRAGVRLQMEVLRAYREGRPIVVQLPGLADELRDLAVLCHLLGLERESRDVVLSHERAVAALQRRLAISHEKLRELSVVYNARAVQVVEGVRAATEARLQTAMITATRAGAHVREGVQELERAFRASGITPANSFTLEATFRTQTQMAYGAGKWEADQDPVIQEALWGYKYVTIGDDRVRDSHAELEGAQAPKDDPFWEQAWPPNGWACRCQVISIFDERPTYLPTKGGPDEGFAFNPGRLFQTTHHALGKTTPTVWGEKARELEEAIARLYREEHAAAKAKKWGAEMKAAVKRDRLKQQRLVLKRQHPEAYAKGKPTAPRRPKTLKESKTLKEPKPRTGDEVSLRRELNVERPLVGDLDEQFMGELVKETRRLRKAFPTLDGGLAAETADTSVWKLKLRHVTRAERKGSLGRYSYTNREMTLTNPTAGYPARGPLTLGEFGVDQSGLGAFRHELGHHWWYQHTDVNLKREWVKTHRSMSKAGRKRVSQYAATAPEESFAECFSTYAHPKYVRGSLPKKFESLLDDALRVKPSATPKALAKIEKYTGVNAPKVRFVPKGNIPEQLSRVNTELKKYPKDWRQIRGKAMKVWDDLGEQKKRLTELKRHYVRKKAPTYQVKAAKEPTGQALKDLREMIIEYGERERVGPGVLKDLDPKVARWWKSLPKQKQQLLTNYMIEGQGEFAMAPIEKILATAPKGEGVFWRGMANLKPADMKQFVKGAEITLNRTTSISRQRAVADVFTSKKRGVTMRIKAKQAVDVRQAAEFGNQEEFLIQMGSRLKVTKVRKVGANLQVELEQIL